MELIRRKSLKINAVLNVIRQACAVLFPLIVYPYITRTIGVDFFGRYSFADSVVSFFTVLAMLGVSTYAIREASGMRDDKIAIDRFASEMLIINGLAFLVSIIFLFCITILVPRIKDDWIIICILAIGIFANVIGRDWINVVYEDYFYITLRYIIIHIISLGLMLVLVKNPTDYYIFAVLMVLTNSGGYLINVLYIRKYTRIVKVPLKGIRKHLKPIFILFSISIASKIYINSDITILGFMVSDEALGIYSISSKVYLLVKALVNAAMQVAIPRISKNVQENKFDEVKAILKRIKNGLFVVIIPLAVGVVLKADAIIRILCGEEYGSSGQSLQVLAGALVFAVFACYYAHLVLVPSKKERSFANATFLSVIANVGLNLVLIPHLGILGAAISTVVSEIVVLLICLINSDELYVKIDKTIMVLAAVCGGITYVVCGYFERMRLPAIYDIMFSFFASVVLCGIVLYCYEKVISKQKTLDK
ncbi:flippase [Butyrivibrio sp. CB08]|uniref:flippase n=1 Tax=Butyrivibrio sp. CB08 TaxID=2364879 RepID=UPI000EAA2F0E|nr:flippase [Butyrivibrio sp. CB08]RKM61923.1 flippase [Butyrivibrio sp. CB08]